MRKTLLTLTLIGLCSLIYGQQRIALHHNGTTTIFGGTTPYIDAYNAALNGDTIYVSGGNYSAPGNYSKRLVIIGTGYNTDSTTATGRSDIGAVNLIDGADGSVFEGLYISGGISFGYDHKIDSVRISRCLTSNIYISGTYTTNKSTGVMVRETIVTGGIICDNAENIIVFNNVLRWIYNIPQNGWINHNVFLSYTGWPYCNVGNANNCLIENNYFTSGTGTNYYSTFRNNAFSIASFVDAQNTYISNYFSVTPSMMFINYQDPFVFSANYHLISPSSYPGSDATQVGIFGGPQPFKDGGLPRNPHIRSANIPLNTDVNGNLNINIQTGAQQQ